MKINAWDFIRVVNLRGDPEYMATEDERVISANRTAGAVLGNPHIAKNRSMQERDRVVSAFKQTFKDDLAVQGPMWQICQKIADDIVNYQQKIALSCYCAPAPCHLHGVVPVIVQMVEEKLKLLESKEDTNIKHNRPKL